MKIPNVQSWVTSYVCHHCVFYVCKNSRFVGVGQPCFQANKASLHYEICFAGQTDTVNRKIAKEHFLTGINN